MNLGEFLRMGGYGGFVWPSYALWLAVIVGNILSARRMHADALTHARRRLASRVADEPTEE